MRQTLETSNGETGRGALAPHPMLLDSPGAAAPASETGRMLLAHDWAATPLGPMEHWPRSLRIAVSICLNSRFPMFVWWGPSLVNIYNDAYVPVLGRKHPGAFGAPARDWWGEIWDVLNDQVDAVMVHGRASWNERVLLVMDRKGYPEDTWFTWSYSPIYDDQGGIGGLFCACTEETGRVAAERERDRLVDEAQDAARSLRNWFDHAPGFIAFLRGPDLVFEMANEAYCQLVGHRRIEGLPIPEALPEMPAQGFVELLQHVYRTGEPYVGRAVSVEIQPVPGGPRHLRFVDFVYQPVRDAAGQVAGILAQGHDVTEQVLGARALEEADRRKDEFVATLAHELRNPLAPIRQAAALARDGADAQRQAWALGVIERQVNHMALLLDDLLDVSRISRGRLELRLQQVALADVVDAAVETVRPLFDAKRHRLTVRLPPRLSLRVDPVRLAQVLSNLLSNAGKYTDAGGRIDLEGQVDAETLVLRVRDNGIGLSTADSAQIFAMFSQVTAAMDRAEGGLGIGLALTRGLVELHGGQIEARSDGPGKGSEFSVTLPTRMPDQPAPPAAAQREPQPTGPRPRKVLLADDNADALETMAALLQIEGHEVETASDGRRALEAGEKLRPDVAILDIGMPHLNGYEAAARIRATDWGRKVVLIALTGWGQEQDQARAREAGFDHHCTKPVDIERLLQLVQDS